MELETGMETRIPCRCNAGPHRKISNWSLSSFEIEAQSRNRFSRTDVADLAGWDRQAPCCLVTPRVAFSVVSTC